jgi:tRNA (guanosine-2'-O-)-methyltransferase
MSHLQNMISLERHERMLKILNERTRYMSVILENLYDSHNISAILRTAEAYGIQNIHVVEETNPFVVSKGVSMGAHQWLTVEKHKSVEKIIHSLKEKGHRIYYADPKQTNPSIEQIALDKPFSIIMGQEKQGISQKVKEHAHGGFRLSLYGFVESFNVSVAFAIIAATLIERLRKENPQGFFLSEKEKEEILKEWVLHNNFNKKIETFLKQN